ncbi:amidohydrolase [Sphingobium lignivorans]|uniref:Aminobenzoyl-glutamate utilization protein B n=1 Tax=Sphingobium lignivorans TaxID=2735886 RepID=A0ABR6NHK0_9SPHN|nr:amidohydrolase [Sphingobium lignivorans]MBB5986741.1 aminobenzoyl-glutamate utilization protein B [Sphingobium lignivorans]
MKLILRSLLLLSGAIGTPLLAAPLSDMASQSIMVDIDRDAPVLSKTALDIWHYGEVGFQETKSSALLQKELQDAGFKVEAGVAGMPTAFVASFRTGKGPVIGILAEFDALPGMSQAAAAERAAQPDMENGHGCGHNLFGAASVAAAIATKRWMIANNVQGEIRVYGSPAEEGGSGKVFLVRAGLTKDVSAMLHWHPGDRNSASQGRTLANVSGKFRFKGLSAHAAAAPDRGRSALDGVEAMNNMVNMMREHVPQETRIHYVITDGGKAPNVVPETAEVYYYIRHPDQRTVAQIVERVKRAAEGAALGTGTTVAFDQTGGTFDTLPNDVLGHVMHGNLLKVAAPSYSAKEQAFIDQVSATFPAAARRTSRAVEPYASGIVIPASSDVGDVSYTTPTVGMSAATWAPGTPAHSWQAVAASGHSVGVKGAVVAAKAMALTAAELFQSPDVLAAAQAELEKRRGGDFVYKSLLGDNPPALDYRKNQTAG